MKTASKKNGSADASHQTIAEVLGIVPAQRETVPTVDPHRVAARKEMDRIFETLNDRVHDILLSLGVRLTEVHASWGPVDEYEGLAAKLAHIEIIPEVKANV